MKGGCEREFWVEGQVRGGGGGVSETKHGLPGQGDGLMPMCKVKQWSTYYSLMDLQVRANRQVLVIEERKV